MRSEYWDTRVGPGENLKKWPQMFKSTSASEELLAVLKNAILDVGSTMSGWLDWIGYEYI